MKNNPQNSTQTQVPPEQGTPPMQMDVKIHAVRASGPVLANASVTLNSCFAVRGVKVIAGENGPFVSMPSYKAADGYKDICFPCTKQFHRQFQDTVVAAYQQALSQLPQRREPARPAQEQEAPPAPQMSM